MVDQPDYAAEFDRLVSDYETYLEGPSKEDAQKNLRKVKRNAFWKGFCNPFGIGGSRSLRGRIRTLNRNPLNRNPLQELPYNQRSIIQNASTSRTVVEKVLEDLRQEGTSPDKLQRMAEINDRDYNSRREHYVSLRKRQA